jgi:hypothetical protein
MTPSPSTFQEQVSRPAHYLEYREWADQNTNADIFLAGHQPAVAVRRAIGFGVKDWTYWLA